MSNKLGIILADTIKRFSFEISGIMPSYSSRDFGHKLQVAFNPWLATTARDHFQAIPEK